MRSKRKIQRLHDKYVIVFREHPSDFHIQKSKNKIKKSHACNPSQKTMYLLGIESTSKKGNSPEGQDFGSCRVIEVQSNAKLTILVI
jgi:hypothetical protein